MSSITKFDSNAPMGVPAKILTNRILYLSVSQINRVHKLHSHFIKGYKTLGPAPAHCFLLQYSTSNSIIIIPSIILHSKTCSTNHWVLREKASHIIYHNSASSSSKLLYQLNYVVQSHIHIPNTNIVHMKTRIRKHSPCIYK